MPVVVTVQTPPTSPWMHLVELVVPGIIGAGLALFGVWLTNKHNAAENRANRSFALKRDVLTRVTQSLVQTIHAVEVLSNARTTPEYLENSGATAAETEQAVEDIEKAWAEFRLRRTELTQNIATASLAVSDDLWKSAQAIAQSIEDANLEAYNRNSGWTSRLEGVQHQVTEFTQEARKELGIVRIAGTPNRRENDH